MTVYLALNLVAETHRADIVEEPNSDLFHQNRNCCMVEVDPHILFERSFFPSFLIGAYAICVDEISHLFQYLKIISQQ